MTVLKKGLVTEIIVLNYAKSYVLIDKKLVKKEKKLISFSVSEQDREKVIAFIEQVSGRTRENGELSCL